MLKLLKNKALLINIMHIQGDIKYLTERLTIVFLNDSKHKNFIFISNDVINYGGEGGGEKRIKNPNLIIVIALGINEGYKPWCSIILIILTKVVQKNSTA